MSNAVFDEGVDASIVVTTRENGGVYLRPLRGDMLRVPHSDPQVCMHACMYVCTYVCMYVCMYVRMYVCVNT